MRDIILVTGGTGFIGSHLVEALVSRGDRVRCLVRRTSNITHLQSLDVELIYGDLLDRGSLREALKGINTVYHLAAQVRPHRVVSRLKDFANLYYRVNAVGTANLADICSDMGIAKFVYFSSIAAVGTGENLIESSPCLPITEYGRSKFAAERHILELAKNKNFPALIIRPGQIYGPGCMAMVLLFKLIKQGMFLTFGKGNNWIPVCYVDDLIEGSLLISERGREGEIYFIFEKCYTFREYAQAIANSVGGYLSKAYIPKHTAYMAISIKEACEKIIHLKICPFGIDLSRAGIISISSSWLGSIEKAMLQTGFTPKINLREGIARTTEWYKNRGLL
jgi:nucleoside-diphosphate-sugar epimerase